MTPGDYGTESARRLALLGADGLERGDDVAPDDADLADRVEQTRADVRGQA